MFKDVIISCVTYKGRIFLTSVQVPTPQRLSQLGGPSTSAPVEPSELKERGMTSTRRLSTKKLQHSCPVRNLKEESSDMRTPESGEEYERVELDPLVFDREDFNSGEGGMGQTLSILF